MSKTIIYCPIVGCSAVATDKHHIAGHGSPTIWLCKNCHGRLHGVSWNSDHSVLTKQGIAKAKAEGRSGGNPGLMAGNPDMIRKISAIRAAGELERLTKASVSWMPAVRVMRPDSTWGDVARAIGGDMTTERLRRSVKRLVGEGLEDARLLGRSPIRSSKHPLTDLIKVLAETRTLQQVAQRLEDMGERTPRGGTRWHPSSVRNLLMKG